MSFLCLNSIVPTNLTNPQTLVIFTTSPAGLGHLRVTDALLEGLPKDAKSFILGAIDPHITYLHRLSSQNFWI